MKKKTVAYIYLALSLSPLIPYAMILNKWADMITDQSSPLYAIGQLAITALNALICVSLFEFLGKRYDAKEFIESKTP